MLIQRQQQKRWWWRWYWPGFHRWRAWIDSSGKRSLVSPPGCAENSEIFLMRKYYEEYSIINDQSPQRWGNPWGQDYCELSTPRSSSNPWMATLGSCSARGFWGEKNWFSSPTMLLKNLLSRWMWKMSLTDLWDCSMAGRRLHGSQKCCSSPCPWANNSR